MPTQLQYGVAELSNSADPKNGLLIKLINLSDAMKVTANFRYNGFYDLLCDAVYQHRLAHNCSDSYLMNRHARASISASALTLESCANSLITSLEIPSILMNDIDKLPVVSKFDTYLRFRDIETFDRGKSEVQKIVELIRARNDYVHPKATNIKTDVGQFEDQEQFVALPLDLHGDIWKEIDLPKRALFWSADNALSVLKAIMGFFSYLFRDLMQSDVEKVRYLLLSRLELENTRVPNYFKEFEDELNRALEHGVDFGFLVGVVKV